MGLISRVSSRTYRVNLGPKWPLSQQSFAKRTFPQAKAMAETHQDLVQPGGQESRHDRSPALSAQLSSAQLSDTTPSSDSAAVTLEEVKGAGMSVNAAKKIGIAVDFRRRNKSAESVATNVARLKAYKQKVIVLKKGDTTDVEQSLAQKIMPVSGIPFAKLEVRKITDEERKGCTYQAFHMAKANVK